MLKLSMLLPGRPVGHSHGTASTGAAAAGRAVRRSRESDQGVDKVGWGTDGRHQNAGDSVAEDETGALSHGSLNRDRGVASLPRT